MTRVIIFAQRHAILCAALIHVTPYRGKAPGRKSACRFAQTSGRFLALKPPMTEELETFLEQAARARRFAIVLHGDPAALDLEQCAEELEQEIHRRSREESLR